jgi:hypothetical protein
MSMFRVCCAFVAALAIPSGAAVGQLVAPRRGALVYFAERPREGVPTGLIPGVVVAVREYAGSTPGVRNHKLLVVPPVLPRHVSDLHVPVDAPVFAYSNERTHWNVGGARLLRLEKVKKDLIGRQIRTQEEADALGQVEPATLARLQRLTGYLLGVLPELPELHHDDDDALLWTPGYRTLLEAGWAEELASWTLWGTTATLERRPVVVVEPWLYPQRARRDRRWVVFLDAVERGLAGLSEPREEQLEGLGYLGWNEETRAMAPLDQLRALHAPLDLLERQLRADLELPVVPVP